MTSCLQNNSNVQKFAHLIIKTTKRSKRIGNIRDPLETLMRWRPVQLILSVKVQLVYKREVPDFLLQKYQDRRPKTVNWDPNILKNHHIYYIDLNQQNYW